MQEQVHRVQTADGTAAYVRPDDGSSGLMRRLNVQHSVPVPEVIDARQGWLLLTALPGVPLSDPRWHRLPAKLIAVAAEALQCLDNAGVTHGDLCLPNVLGDPGTSHLTGIVDWRYADRYSHEVDVAAAVWSIGFNTHSDDVAVAVLRAIGWPRSDAGEVSRLRATWVTLGDRGGSECTSR